MRWSLAQIRKTIFVLILMVVTGGLGYCWGSRQINLPLVTINRQLPSDKQNLDFNLFWQVYDRLNQAFFDRQALKPQAMIYGAIKGLVTSLGDPYSVFLTPEENKDSKDDLNGSFEGVGIQLGYKNDNQLVVIAPLAGLPAETAGVKAGDLILKIDQKETAGISLPEAVKLIRGPKGSQVKLTLLHQNESQPYEVELTREMILVPSVELKINNQIAHLKLTRFGDRTNQEWDEAVNQIISQKAKGVILDLRDNPGGYLEGSVYIVSEFVNSGVVVKQETANGQKESFSVNRQGKLLKIPLVVIVNQGSASASEIVAGALWDYNRAKIVGEKTFGKGTIQEAEDLSGGAGLHITTSHWLLPKDESIDKVGLKPDYEVTDDPKTETDEVFEKAMEIILK